MSPWQLSCRQCCKKQMTSVLVNVCCERGNTWSRRRKAVTASSFFFLGRGSPTTARTGERAGSAGPSVSHVVRPAFYCIIFLVSRPRQAGSGGASGRRTNRRFSMGAAHSHTHTPTPDRSSRLGSVSRRLPLLRSLLPPLPRRTDRRRENANDETSASALFTCGRTSRR